MDLNPEHDGVLTETGEPWRPLVGPVSMKSDRVKSITTHVSAVYVLTYFTWNVKQMNNKGKVA